MLAGFKVTMHVRVVTKKNAHVLLPTEEYVCVVQPPPHYTHRQNILDVQIEAMAKVKFMTEMYARMHNERDITRQLAGREWIIEAVILEVANQDAVAA